MIVGIDVSSRRIDLAWLEDGKPCRWHQELIGNQGKHLIDRLRAIHVQWPQDVNEIAIEYPFSVHKQGIAALMAVTGIVTHQAPSYCRVAWPSSGELRQAIGAKNTKADAHEAIHMHACPIYERDECILTDWNEHSLDALVAAVGWQKILEAQDA